MSNPPSNEPVEPGLLATLIQTVAPLTTEIPVLRAYEAFSSDANLYAIAVVDDDEQPVGLINRFKFLERLSRPFGRDLSVYQQVSAMMEPAPLIVDEGVPLDDLSNLLVDDATRYIFDGFIVTRGGRYLGIGTGYTLVRCLSERKHAALFHLAHHDPLTGLANRQLFTDRLDEALGAAARNGARAAVLYVDVDRFKAVNDNLGHAVGDVLLGSIADRLRSSVRIGDTVARLSGDEFAVILHDLQHAGDGEAVAQKVLTALRLPHSLERNEINVSCSIGVAVFPDDATTQPALLRAADAATYHAKQFRNTCQRYSSDIPHGPASFVAPFGSIQRALEERHLKVVYQPLIVCATGELFGVEALVRWNDPERGPLATSDLIRLAEDSGLILEVTEFVLGQALSQMLEWERDRVASGLVLAVNVSSVELREGALVPLLRRQLELTRFPPHMLELEITESTAMLSGTFTTAVLKELRTLGVHLSIDDFGTGYSSLSRLRRLPVHALKIDRTFVEDIELSGSSALAQAIIVMAHSLGLAVTGEGVETQAQYDFLKTHGCDRMQGYFIARPLDASAMTTYMRQVAVGQSSSAAPTA